MSDLSTPPRLNSNTIAMQSRVDVAPQLNVAQMWLAWDQAS